MLVSICVATYRRPEGLRELLAGLNRLSFVDLAPPNIDVVVVDNEGRGTATSVCREVERQFRWTLRSYDEPRRGITHARNRGLVEASPDSRFVAFIDDDEVPEPSWLEALLLAQQRYGADVVCGPVVPRLPPDVPAWVERGGFFAPRLQPDGAPLHVAFTNNVLLGADIPHEMGRMFDHRFALSGGEDTDFFMRAHRAGYRIVWARGAVVCEAIPRDRATATWILRRGYREWGSHSLSERELYPSARVGLERVAKATMLILGGVVSLPVSLLLGRHRTVRSLLWVARGLGSFSGLLGRQYLEYDSPAVRSDTS